MTKGNWIRYGLAVFLLVATLLGMIFTREGTQMFYGFVFLINLYNIYKSTEEVICQ